MWWALSLALADPVSATAADLSGTWRVDLHLVHQLSVPLLGRSPSDSDTVQLWRIADGSLTNEHCSITASTRRRIGRPTIPDTFARAIRHTTVPVTLEGDRVRVDMGVARIGYEPTEAGDVFPDDAEAAGIVDHEGDGLPGATISVWAPIFGDVELYVVQRTHLLLDGVFDGATVTGTATQAVFDQRTIGATRRMFVQSPSIVPVPEDSTFRMRPMPAEVTCDDPRMAPLAAQ